VSTIFSSWTPKKSPWLLLDQALANERLAELLLKQNLKEDPRYKLERAIDLYGEWKKIQAAGETRGGSVTLLNLAVTPLNCSLAVFADFFLLHALSTVVQKGESLIAGLICSIKQQGSNSLLAVECTVRG
jgi:hypothetical protein